MGAFASLLPQATLRNVSMKISAAPMADVAYVTFMMVCL
jgi:hypothetical protein